MQICGRICVCVSAGVFIRLRMPANVSTSMLSESKGCLRSTAHPDLTYFAFFVLAHMHVCTFKCLTSVQVLTMDCIVTAARLMHEPAPDPLTTLFTAPLKPSHPPTFKSQVWPPFVRYPGMSETAKTDLRAYTAAGNNVWPRPLAPVPVRMEARVLSWLLL